MLSDCRCEQTGKARNLMDRRIWHGDCLESLRKLSDDTIKVVVTSPPYNLGDRVTDPRTSLWKVSPLMNPNVSSYPDHDDNMPYPEYVEWQRDVLTECLRVLTPDGAIFYNHKWRIQNNRLRQHHDILHDFPLRQIIVWERNGAMAQGTTSTGMTRFMPNIEVIYLICKSGEFRLSDGAWKHGVVWRFNHDADNAHPAPFPIGIPLRCISSVKGYEGGVVLDPFLGSGTTAVAAETLGCDWLGFEKTLSFCEMADGRLQEFKRQGRLAL